MISGFLSRITRWQFAKNMISRYMYGAGFSDLPVLIDCEDLWTPYTLCPHLNVVINKKAEMMANGQWKCVSVDDETDEHPDDEGLKLLLNPNTMQSSEEFIKQYSRYGDIWANNFLYPLKATKSSFPKELKWLPSGTIEIQKTGKFYKQRKVEDIFSGYKTNVGGEEIIYSTEEVVYIPQDFDPVYMKGMSKIPPLQLPISNINAALKTRNIIMTKKGAIGVLGAEVKDALGTQPLAQKERERIEAEMSKDHGLYETENNIKISNVPLKWTPMSYPTRELMLIEEVEDSFSAILAAYGMDRDLFPSTKGATNENKSQAVKSTYQNTIIPAADSLANIMTKVLGTDPKRKYILSYDWIPELQEDQLKQEQTRSTKAYYLLSLHDKGAITTEQVANEMGFELQQVEGASAEQQAKQQIFQAAINLRGLVGTMQSVVQLNTAVAQGLMERETAVATLMNLLQIDQATAESMVTNMVAPPPSNNQPAQQNQSQAGAAVSNN